MGHKRQRKTLSLRFEDEPGLEIFARSCSVRRFLRTLQAVDKIQAGNLPQDELEEFVHWFAGRIITWNLEDDHDQPIPVSADYLLDEDIDWAAKVLMGWVSGILQVFNVPLDLAALTQLAQAQATGAPPETDPVEASIPMSPARPASATGT